jgi:hypothetical protein
MPRKARTFDAHGAIEAFIAALKELDAKENILAHELLLEFDIENDLGQLDSEQKSVAWWVDTINRIKRESGQIAEAWHKICREAQ